MKNDPETRRATRPRSSPARRHQNVVAGIVGALALCSVALCPPEGGATDGKKLTALEIAQNPLKNRTTMNGAAICGSITLASILAPGNDQHRFNSNCAATITGYVALVKKGGVESCNCQSKTDLDTHIVLVAHEGDAKQLGMVVEVTPHTRKISTAELQRRFLHKWVTVTGLMFYDSAHMNVSANTMRHGVLAERQTCTEIHPVFDIKEAKQ